MWAGRRLYGQFCHDIYEATLLVGWAWRTGWHVNAVKVTEIGRHYILVEFFEVLHAG